MRTSSLFICLQTLTFFAVCSQGNAADRLLLETSHVDFSAPSGSQLSQNLSLTSSGMPLNFTATEGYVSTATGWLSVAPSGGFTPARVNIAIDSRNLSNGSYMGYVRFAYGRERDSFAIVTLHVGSQVAAAPSAQTSVAAADRSAFSIYPQRLIFNHQIGTRGPIPQPILVATPGQRQPFKAAAGADWIQLVSRSSPTPTAVIEGASTGHFDVQVDAGDRGPGSYEGYVSVTDANNRIGTVPVTLNVSVLPYLELQPPSMQFRGSARELAAASQSLVIRIAGGNPQPRAAVESGSWLALSDSGTGAKDALWVVIDPSQVAVGQYAGSISVTAPGAERTILPVALNYTPQAAGIAVDPASLTFQSSSGGPKQTKTISVTSSSSPEQFLVDVHAGSWLTSSADSETTPATISFTADPTVLTYPGTYNGFITFTGLASNEQIIGNVSFTVTSTATSGSLVVNPASLSFVQTTGGAAPPSQSLTLSASRPIAFTASSSSAWLSVTPVGGTSPATLVVSVSGSGMPPGTYQGAITVMFGGGETTTVPVTLTVSGSPSTLSPSPASLSFSQTLGGAAPPSQAVTLNSTTGAAAFTAVSNSAWLSVSPANGTTPATLVVSVNGTSLTAGTYQGAITVTAGNSTSSIPVTLTVASSPSPLSASPATLDFSQAVGGAAPASQTLNVTSTGGNTSFTAASSNPTWLSVTPASAATPAILTVTVNGSSLSPGFYQGSVNLTAGSSTLAVPVTLTVSGASTGLSATPVSLSFTQAAGGAAPPPQSIVVDNSAGPSPVTVTTNANWLAVIPSGTTTPITYTIAVNGGSLGAGTFSSFLSFTSAGNTIAVPVTVNVTPMVVQVISPAPAALTFSQVLGKPAAAAQTLSVTGTNGPTNFTAAANSPYITVTPSSGTTPATLSVTTSATGMSPGTYKSSITLTSGAVSSTVPVTLTVSAPVITLNVSPTALLFTGVAAGTSPATRSLSLTSSGTPLSFTAVATTANGNWLSVTPGAGTTPASLTVAVTSTGLAAGQYSGSIAITPNDPTVSPAVVNVTLSLTAPPVAQGPVITAVLNGASWQPGPLAPGEIITILGAALGPATGSLGIVLPSGSLAFGLSDTRVLFDGVPAPLLWVRAEQVNAIVPYEIYGRVATTFQVEVAGVRSDPLQLRVAETAPGVFANSGAGQGAILNQDGTVNSVSLPAATRSIVSIFATGEGQTRSPGQDGRIIATDLRAPLAPVTVKIGGMPMDVRYAGSAPGLVSGALQVNVYLPDNVPTGGQVPVEVSVGGVPSQLGVTIAIK